MKFEKFLKISNKKYISNNHPVFIIAEIGVNHEGNYRKCLKLINLANKAGADAIKIQLANPDTNYNKYSKSYKIYKKSFFNNNQIKNIYKYAKRKNIILFATADSYYFEIIKKLNQKLFKISSSQAQDLVMIQKINKLNKPMIISTGMNTFEEVISIINFLKKLKNKKIILLHCISKYPTKKEEANISMINLLKKTFNGIVGYSDHTKGIAVSSLAVAMGAKVIEKHFTDDTSRKGYDHKISSDYSEFKNMVKNIRVTEEIIGSKYKNNSIKKTDKIKLLKRSFFAKKNLKKGKKLKLNDLYTRRIRNNSSVLTLLNSLDKKIKKNYKKDTKVL